MAHCSRCGFLTAIKDGEYAEISEQARENPHALRYRPLCFKKRKDFGNLPNYGGPLLEEHDCQQFIEYRFGYGPKEHDEMHLLAEVERRTQAFQRTVEDTAERRHQETLAVAQGGLRVSKWALGVSIATAFLAAGVAIWVASLEGRLN